MKRYLRWFVTLVKILLPVALLVGAVSVAKALIASRPVPAVVPAEQIVPLVEIYNAQPSVERVEVRAEGFIEPKWEAELSAQVAGQVLDVADSFQAGRSVRKGEVLVSIERVQYAAQYARAQAAIANVKRVLAEEEALGAQALKEWTRSGRRAEDIGPLTLRTPQIEAAQADLFSAEANLQTAALDLERTLVRAPFDGVVEARSVSPGDVVSVGRSLGRLLGSDVFEARLALSPTQAARLALPTGGPSAEESLTVHLTASALPGRSWSGVLTRTEARIDTRNRLVTVIAEVPDPLSDPANRLPAGTFVEATIPGPMLTGVQLLPESAVFEDKYVWILENDALIREPVQREFSRDGQACVRFLQNPLAPRRVVRRPLPSYREGVAVEVKVDGG